MSSDALRKDRRTKLRQFFRVGMFAIATTIAAIVLVRVLAVKRQTDLVTEKLQFAELRDEELRQSNEGLSAASKLSASLYPAACTNGEFINRFYQLCREPSDLPPIKTDFIVGCNYEIDLSRQGIAFSVPDGSHTLELTIGQYSFGAMDERKQSTKIEFPLLPSAGYFVRFTSVDDAEGEDDATLFIELSGNNPEFKTIRRALPNTVGLLLDYCPRYDLIGVVEHLVYPSGSSIATIVPEHSAKIATGYATGQELRNQEVWLSLNIVSDARQSVTGKVARAYIWPNGPFEPYTGNGRLYSVPPKVSIQTTEE